MSQDRIPILLNPAAGKGKAGRDKDRLEKLLHRLEIPFDLYLTRSEEDLRNLTKAMASRHRTIVGAGGDSTFQIMVDELMKMESRPNLGIIGLGSSNDITREFSVESLKKACLTLKRGKTKAIDVGCLWCNNKALLYFLGQVNIGLGVTVNQHVERLIWHSSFLGKKQTLAGLLAIIKTYKQKRIPIALEVESATERVKDEFTAIVVSNIRYWATGRLINPQARVDDGVLNACLIKRCSLGRLFRLIELSRRGKHDRAKEVSFLRSPVFRVRSSQAFAIQADGEIPGGWSSPLLFTEIQVGVIPAALSVFLGSDHANLFKFKKEASP